MRRVVVTGVGAVSPCGLTTEATWEAITAGRSGIGRIEGFDPEAYASQIAGECTGFDPELYFEKKKIKETARFSQLAMGASHMAIENAGFEPDDELKERTGTFIGVGFCGLDAVEAQHKRLLEKGPRRISPYFIPASISNLAPGHVSMRWGLKGPSFTTTSACSSGAHAIGEAYGWIARGGIDAAVAGGSEASVTPLGVGGFAAMRALSKRNDEPEKASRPFDKGRDGFVIGEGAAVLILEERESAIKRGANIIAEIVGYGASADAYHLTQPSPGGEGAIRAVKMALRDAGVNPEQIDYLNAHGTSTPVGDVQELLGAKTIFGAHATAGTDGLWISSTKSMTGHLLGAAGGLESALTVMAIRDGVVPPTINLEDPDEAAEGLELVPNVARERKVRYALSNSFGFGGTNASLVFAHPDAG